jgi:hypothetical protein
MCLLVEYMEYCAYCRRVGLGVVSYADFIGAYEVGDSHWMPEAFWSDDERADV